MPGLLLSALLLAPALTTTLWVTSDPFANKEPEAEVPEQHPKFLFGKELVEGTWESATKDIKACKRAGTRVPCRRRSPCTLRPHRVQRDQPPGGGGHGQAPGTEPTASPLKRASNLATAPLQILTKPHKTTDKKRFKNSM